LFGASDKMIYLPEKIRLDRIAQYHNDIHGKDNTTRPAVGQAYPRRQIRNGDFPFNDYPYQYPLSVLSDPTSSTWQNNYAPATYGYTFTPGQGISSYEPITNMKEMFKDNLWFNDPLIALWDVSAVTDMDEMFYGATTFNIDISNWNISKVAALPFNFIKNTSITTSYRDLEKNPFNTSSFKIPAGKRRFYYPLRNTSYIKGISDDEGSGRWMYYYGSLMDAIFIPNDGIYTSSPITMCESMFYEDYEFNDPDIALWDMSTVRDISFMFYGCRSFNQPIGDWDLSSLKGGYMHQNFLSGCHAFNQDLKNWGNYQYGYMMASEPFTVGYSGYPTVPWEWNGYGINIDQYLNSLTNFRPDPVYRFGDDPNDPNAYEIPNPYYYLNGSAQKKIAVEQAGANLPVNYTGQNGNYEWDGTLEEQLAEWYLEIENDPDISNSRKDVIYNGFTSFDNVNAPPFEAYAGPGKYYAQRAFNSEGSYVFWGPDFEAEMAAWPGATVTRSFDFEHNYIELEENIVLTRPNIRYYAIDDTNNVVAVPIWPRYDSYSGIWSNIKKQRYSIDGAWYLSPKQWFENGSVTGSPEGVHWTASWFGESVDLNNCSWNSFSDTVRSRNFTAVNGWVTAPCKFDGMTDQGSNAAHSKTLNDAWRSPTELYARSIYSDKIYKFNILRWGGAQYNENLENCWSVMHEEVTDQVVSITSLPIDPLVLQPMIVKISIGLSQIPNILNGLEGSDRPYMDPPEHNTVYGRFIAWSNGNNTLKGFIDWGDGSPLQEHGFGVFKHEYAVAGEYDVKFYFENAVVDLLSDERGSVETSTFFYSGDVYTRLPGEKHLPIGDLGVSFSANLGAHNNASMPIKQISQWGEGKLWDWEVYGYDLDKIYNYANNVPNLCGKWSHMNTIGHTNRFPTFNTTGLTSLDRFFSWQQLPEAWINWTAADFNFDISNVKSMNSCFGGNPYEYVHGWRSYKNAIVDLPSVWDTSNVVNMSGMFAVNGWQMFTNIGNFDTSSCKHFDYMFAGLVINGQGNENIGDESLIVNASDDLDMNVQLAGIENWNTSNVLTMDSMFCDPRFNYDVSSWNMSNVVSVANMFHGAKIFNQPIGSWDLSSCKSTYSMFFRATDFNNGAAVGVPSGQCFNLGTNWIQAYNMFAHCLSFNGDITHWDARKLVHGERMFTGCSNLIMDISSWICEDIMSVWDMFTSAPGITGNISHWEFNKWYSAWNRKDKNAADLSEFSGALPYAHYGDYEKHGVGGYRYPLSGLTDPTTQYWRNNYAPPNYTFVPGIGIVSNGEKITNTTGMFEGNTTFNDRELLNWDLYLVRHIDTADDMFKGCTALNQDLSSWNIITGTNIASVDFATGTQLTSNMYPSFTTPASYITYPLSNTTKSQITNTDASDRFGGALQFEAGWEGHSADNSTIMDSIRVLGGFHKFIEGVGIISCIPITSLAIYPTNNNPKMIFENTFNDPDISNWDVSSMTDFALGFQNFTVFNQDLSSWDVSAVEDMSFMFKDAVAFNNGGVALTWTAGTGTANVISMNHMFQNANAFNQDISSWNVSNVRSMTNMFSDAHAFNNGGVSLSGWDTSKNISFESMFYNAYTFNNGQPIDQAGAPMTWDTTGWRVLDERGAVPGFLISDTRGVKVAAFIETLFGVRGLTRKVYAELLQSNGYPFWTNDPERDASDRMGPAFMFLRAHSFNQDLSSFTPVGYCEEMLSDAARYQNGNVPLTWDFSNVEYGGELFTSYNSTSNTNNAPVPYGFNQDISSWDTSGLKDAGSMFYKNEIFNQDISSWNVSNVTVMYSMFYDATAFNQDISSWDVSSVTDMNRMFEGAAAFTNDGQTLSGWDVSSNQYFNRMFLNAVQFNDDFSNWNTSGINTFNGGIPNPSSYSDFSTNTGSVIDPIWGTNGGYRLPLTNTSTDPTSQYWRDNHAPAGYQFTPNVGISATAIFTSFERMFEGNPTFNDSDVATWPIVQPSLWDRWLLDESFSFDQMFKNTTEYVHDLSSWPIMWLKIGLEFGLNSGLTEFTLPQFGAPAGKMLWRSDLDIDYTYSEWRTDFAPANYEFIPGIGYVFDDNVLISCEKMFYDQFYSASRISPYMSSWDTSNVTSMASMFHTASYNRDSYFNVDIGGWDVSNVTDMSRMFFGASGAGAQTQFNQDISSWDVSNVTTMSYMFYEADVFNQPLNSWNTSSVIDMYGMFFRADAFNQDISSWDVSNVTDMGGMFYHADAFNNGGVALTWTVGTGTANVIDMSYMFSDAVTFNQDISSWNVSSVYTMSNMFKSATAFNNGGVALTWTAGTGTTNVTDMSRMFQGVNTFNQPLNSWDVSSVTFMGQMFNGALVFNQPLNSWDVSNVTSMSSMFQNATAFNQDISSWDLSGAPNMSNMFNTATVFNNGGVTLSGNFASTMTSVTNMSYMFKYANAFDQDISSWDVSSVTNMAAMFDINSGFNNGGVALNWGVKTVNVTNMNAMFNDAVTFNQDISSWDVSSVTTMNYMFSGASVFDQDISIWNVLAASVAPGNSTPPSGFDTGTPGTWTTAEKPQWGTDGTILYPLTGETSDPTNATWRSTYAPASYVYDTTPGAEGIRVKGNEPITSMQGMFSGSSINNSDISSWDVSTVTNMQQMFDTATVFNQDISSWDTSGLTTAVGIEPANFNTGGILSVANTPYWKLPLAIRYPLVGVLTDPTSSTWQTANVGNYTYYPEAGREGIMWTADNIGIQNMDDMFVGTTFDTDISTWPISTATSMNRMFKDNVTFNQDISGWNSTLNVVTSNAVDFDLNTNPLWLTASKPTFPVYTIQPAGFYEDLLNIPAQNSNAWTQYAVDISAYKLVNIKLVFEYVKTASGFTGDIQIDNIQIGATTYSFETATDGFESNISLSGNGVEYVNASFLAVTTGGLTGKWSRDSNGTGSSNTGRGDAADGSYYLYVETSSGGQNVGNRTWLRSPTISNNNEDTFTFYLAQYGATVGALNVHVEVVS